MIRGDAMEDYTVTELEVIEIELTALDDGSYQRDGARTKRQGAIETERDR